MPAHPPPPPPSDLTGLAVLKSLPGPRHTAGKGPRVIYYILLVLVEPKEKPAAGFPHCPATAKFWPFLKWGDRHSGAARETHRKAERETEAGRGTEHRREMEKDSLCTGGWGTGKGKYGWLMVGRTMAAIQKNWLRGKVSAEQTCPLTAGIVRPLFCLLYMYSREKVPPPPPIQKHPLPLRPFLQASSGSPGGRQADRDAGHNTQVPALVPP